MIEIEPWQPFEDDVKFPVITSDGSIQEVDKRPSWDSPYTAGVVIDDTPLDNTIPFEEFEGSRSSGFRSVGFPVFNIGGAYLIYEAAEPYVELVEQMVGAINLEAELDSDEIFYFVLNEQPMWGSRDDAHHDGMLNIPSNRAAVVSNLLPTYYFLRSLNRYEPDQEPFYGISTDRIPDDIMWCSRTKEITAHQGRTPHAGPVMPMARDIVRRFAEVRVHTLSTIDPVLKTKIEIDDLYHDPEHALELLIPIPDLAN